MATIPIPARDLVTDMVKQRTGNRPSAAWVKRRPDGQADILRYHRQQASPDNAQQVSTRFPILTLTEQWADAEQEKLLNDYFAWQSPILLTLPTLDADTRARMEYLAQDYPLSVYQLHRLYPLVCDRMLMNKVLVEARLRGAGQ